MVLIKLDSIYSIGSDSHNWILLKEDRSFWFFSNLLNLLESYVEIKVRDKNIIDVEKLIFTQEKLLERLLQVVNNTKEKGWRVKR